MTRQCPVVRSKIHICFADDAFDIASGEFTVWGITVSSFMLALQSLVCMNLGEVRQLLHRFKGLTRNGHAIRDKVSCRCNV